MVRSEQGFLGEIVPVRVIGVLGLIDQNETDWKVLVKRTDRAEGVSEEIPGDYLELIRHWFRTYKVAEGCTENELIFNGQLKDASYALDIIAEAHARWKVLPRGLSN